LVHGGNGLISETGLTPEGNAFQAGIVLYMKRSEKPNKRSTIGLKLSTKQRMDRCRAPGQCYDGFITQMMDHWEKTTGKVSHRHIKQEVLPIEQILPRLFPGNYIEGGKVLNA
jgi:hypothetical protein